MRVGTLRLVAPLVFAAALVAGCSDDDDGGSAAPGKDDDATEAAAGGPADAGDGDSRASSETTAKPPPPPDRTRYCETWGRLMAVDDEPYERRDPNSVKAHYSKVLVVARELEAVAPADVKTAVQIAIREAEKVAASGDTSTFSSDESRVNGQRLQEYATQHCS